MQRKLMRAGEKAVDQETRPGPYDAQPVRCSRLFGYPDRGFRAEVHQESLGATVVYIVEVGIGPPALIQGEETGDGFHGFAVRHEYTVHLAARSQSGSAATPMRGPVRVLRKQHSATYTRQAHYRPS